MSALAEQLAALDDLTKRELGDRWVKLTGRPAPKASARLLRLALAYELQAKERRGLPAKLRRRLASDAPPPVALRPGTRLVREHAGKVHLVTIDEDGRILWNEREWRSLSEVARAITGTRWSGPAFFGLKRKANAA